MLQLPLHPSNFPRILLFRIVVDCHCDGYRRPFGCISVSQDCENARHPIEILVEKIRPELRSRPRWEELVGRIKANEVKTLVVPHLFHIAGSNVAQLSDFLRLLEEHEVELITLDQRDQKPLSRSQVLIQFVTTQFKFNERP